MEFPVVTPVLCKKGENFILIAICTVVFLMNIHCMSFCTQDGETAIEFAQRVKADICSKGGLVDLPW